MKFRYEKTVLGWNYHLVNEKTDEILFYPCGELREVRKFAHIYRSEIERQINDMENNYGLSFYVCGYDGQSQTRFRDNWEKRGVHVF